LNPQYLFCSFDALVMYCGVSDLSLESVGQEVGKESRTIDINRPNLGDSMLKNQISGKRQMQSNDNSNQVSNTDQEASRSLFKHEADAIRDIDYRISKQNLGWLLNNLELHDPQSNRYFEVDAIVVCRFGIYVVELKHWSGQIEIRPDTWIQNKSFYKSDPHKVNTYKAKLLRGLWERKFPSIVPPFVESVVILTNREAMVVGASIPKTTSNNPTFDTINDFVKYLKNRHTQNDPKLSESQCKAFIEHLKTLHTAGLPRDFIFPGYEIVERLYQHIDRAEFIARRTDIRHHRLSRLRMFFPPTQANNDQAGLFHERATATINAVAKTGDHPNILKVWSVPNENNYIVEGSDWSETGTLRDLLKEEGSLPIDRAQLIFVGLLKGLQVIHGEYVVHRSLSPENILMLDDTPKLMNFDFSYQLEEQRVTVIPDSSQLKRNPYTAPEIFIGNLTPEGSADLFSCGVILFEMLTGERPFSGSTDLENMDGHLEAIHIQKLVEKKVPELVQKIIRDLVCFDPNQRSVDHKQILQQLEQNGIDILASTEVNRVLSQDDQSDLFQIEDLLSHGVESQIYQARGARARRVIVKLFNSDVSLKRVDEEQRFAAAVHHSSIVRVDSYGRWIDGRLYISFDRVTISNLRHEIDEGIRPDALRCQAVSLQLLDALIALHEYESDEGERSIVHNDIKPGNILITEDGRPILIDFGAASFPHVGVFEGTIGYVAPDLYRGQDREYCPEGDIYSLGITLLEWLGEVDEEDRSPGIQNLLICLNKAVSEESINRYSSAREMMLDVEKIDDTPLTTELGLGKLVRDEGLSDEVQVQPSAGDSVVAELSAGKQAERNDCDVPGVDNESPQKSNPFVAYLNSLHSRNASNENALAESQARNPLFGLIHVPNPIANVVQRLLCHKEKQHAVLTGHAGDGKSIIAVELYKRFMNLSPEEPIAKDLAKREDLTVDGHHIVIIKDFSEWSAETRLELMDEFFDEEGPRFFLISNTGVLLETLREYENAHGRNGADAVSDALGAMNSMTPKSMSLNSVNFSLINLSLIDNTSIVEQLFERMLVESNWESCQSIECRHKCPIFRNVGLMQQNMNMVKARIFLLYRRMFEYGTRFTLRQLSAHLAYIITAGLNCRESQAISQNLSTVGMSGFLFYNRFFGDSGIEVDSPALQLRVVSDVREQGFGELLSPTWERQLWIKGKGESLQVNADGDVSVYRTLQTYGAQLSYDEAISPRQARLQVRRMLFFLHRFEGATGDDFLKTFMKSAMVLDVAKWQALPQARLTLGESKRLRQCVLHVLQEFFAGIKLPEGAQLDHYVVITLSRQSRDVRQSAQVVLATFDRNDFKLSLSSVDNGMGGDRRDLILTISSGSMTAELRLDLPFLDYVILRNKGQVGGDLKVSYVDRLEKFKGQLLQGYKRESTDEITLVRLLTDHTFRRQTFSLRDDKLEVIDG
jgi:serine/threonine protein kinase